MPIGQDSLPFPWRKSEESKMKPREKHPWLVRSLRSQPFALTVAVVAITVIIVSLLVIFVQAAF